MGQWGSNYFSTNVLSKTSHEYFLKHEKTQICISRGVADFASYSNGRLTDSLRKYLIIQLAISAKSANFEIMSSRLNSSGSEVKELFDLESTC